MIVTVLWEDQRGAEVRRFGPHDLLVSCLSDELGIERAKLEKLVRAHPEKGNSNVRKKLRKDAVLLAKSGPVFAVVDRDKIRELWKMPGPMPPDCRSGITERFRRDASGEYDLVFLEDNVETLTEKATSILGRAPLSRKPNPQERDRILSALAYGDLSKRNQLRGEVSSFERLVRRVANILRAREVPDS